jgi:hypothetical protein
MRPTTSTPLAYAFLALADDRAETRQRTLPRALAAATAALVLAVGVPLGWYAAEKPVGALSAKAALAQDDE